MGRQIQPCALCSFVSVGLIDLRHNRKDPSPLPKRPAYFRQPVIGHSSFAVARFSGHTDL